MPSSRLPLILQFAFLFVVLTPPAGAQQNNQQPKAPSTRRVFTNDDVEKAAPQSADGAPQIPGLVQCGTDLKCFLTALDSATPAVITRSETVEVGDAIANSNSTWWTSQFTTDRCTISFRVNTFEARLNAKVVPPTSPDHDVAESKLAEMKRDFDKVRGQPSTCTVAIKDLKILMTPPSWSLMSLGPATSFGKNCSGALFNSLPSAR
jgi:hypothetical protein